MSVASLREHGLHPSTITKRCRPGGPWRRLAKGVVLLGTGAPTRHHLLHATAVALAPDCVLTGIDALDAHGLDQPRQHTVAALLPAHRRVSPPAFATVERTSRLPEPVWIDGLPFAPPARAAMDAARREVDEQRLHDLVAAPVRHGLCTRAELREELDLGNQRGSAAVRARLRRFDHSTGEHAHEMARRLVRRCPIPPPYWDTVIHDDQGARLGAVDAWWDEVGMGWCYTDSARQPGREDREHLALTAAGVVVVRSSPESLRQDGAGVVTRLARAFHQAARRPRPRIRGESPGAFG